MFRDHKKAMPVLINGDIDLQEPDCLPLFLIHPGGGAIDCYDKLLSVDSRQIYGIEFPYHEVKRVFDTPNFKIEWLANLYVQKIRSVVEGPCLIGGWSAGGTIAYAVAKQMSALGKSVPQVIMIDSACPNVYREEQDKVAMVNRQALMFYLDNLNKYFSSRVQLSTIEEKQGFDIDMHLPDLMHFVYETLDIKSLIKKEASIDRLEAFKYTIEGIVRAVLSSHINEDVESIFYIKAAQSDKSSANAWGNFSRQKMQLCEIPNTSHLSIVEEKHLTQLKQIIAECHENPQTEPKAGVNLQ